MSFLLIACDRPLQPETDAVVGPPRATHEYPASTFFETTSYFLSSAPAWSADGTRLLVGSDANGTVNVYALAVNSADPEPLTASETNAMRPLSWFPEDDRVLFTSDEGGNEQTHVYVREGSGEVRDLTPGENLKAVFGGWSDDKTRFFVLTNERDRKAFDLYGYAADGYAREMLFRNEDSWSVQASSANGRYLALVRMHSSADSDLYLLDTEDAASGPQLITPHEGNVSHTAYTFTPDSRKLVYGTDAHGEFRQAWTYDVAARAHSPLATPDWDVAFVFYSESGRYRVTGINEDAGYTIEVLDTRSGARLPLPGLPPGDLAQMRFSPDEMQMALMVSTDTSPRDVYVADLASGEVRRLTQAPNPEIDETQLVESEIIRYPSFDGLQIPGVLYRPRTASAETPAPALVWVHGGPGGQSKRGYTATLQHLVNHGYAVLAANNRGSSGYGKTFYHMDDQRHGEVDLDDIVYAERYLAALDWVDRDRIGIIGGSYGGYMVGAALAFRPDVFKVGVNIFGVMNWVRTLESIPPWWEAQRKSLYDEMGDPATDGERLRRISPLFHADDIHVPLLVVQGANDPRVLQVESDEIVAAVRENEVPVEYVLFPDEGHGFSRRANRITASDAFVAFLNKYLK
ncbi:MAG: alpha/beta fold hydrolase [Pseudomonadales bacterium]|jgi:dipeptidyl aminopeptidase/acylaminoacyl peptidase|nr:alpha/beta fold hydrolase [Pseudomonadales bacterium]MDP6472659.1 alpha/beta fold hydrolase [Pseudomonadales bacterium]MDP6829063.1 alpha/beta fold hydrolase [Pseudomonadales bacterium]MDP6971393.1 alpha/beta fold hydrolase [Pseudomonadales bacterium]